MLSVSLLVASFFLDALHYCFSFLFHVASYFFLVASCSSCVRVSFYLFVVAFVTDFCHFFSMGKDTLMDFGGADHKNELSDIYFVTLDSLKGRLIGVQIKEFDYYFYRLFGFPLALQV